MSAAHLRVLVEPWQERRNQGGLWIWLGIVLLASPILAGLYFVPDLLARTWRYGLALILFIHWMVAFGSLMRQNHPNAARLVPGHLRVLRETAVGVWLLITLITAGILGAAWGLGLALAMLMTAVMFRLPMLWIPLSVILCTVNLWFGPLRLSGLPAWWASLLDLPQLGMAAVALLLMAWGLCLQLQEGGAAHARRYAGQQRLREAMKRSAQGQNAEILFGQSDIIVRMTRWFMTPFFRWMEHLLRTARPGARSIMARAELVLPGHWTQSLAGALIFLAIVGLTIAVAYYFAGDKIFIARSHASFGMTIGAMCSVLSPVMALGAGLYASRREQALLMLLPGMPRGTQLNQLLARRFMWRVLLAWAFGLLFACAMSAGTPSFAPALAFAMSCLPMSLMLWRDWSRMKAPSPMHGAWPALLMVAVGALVAVIAHWLRPSPLWLLSVVPVTLTAGLWRWRSLSTYPQAFPVGRRS